MGFESLATLARRAQYKVTEKPIAYSVCGGVHNVAGKICYFRIRYEFAEDLGWKPGDCLDVLWDKERQIARLVKSEKRGYKLTISSKRNGIASYRIGWSWQDSFGFPDLKRQVSCDIIEVFDGGVELRIRAEDDDSEADFKPYKDAVIEDEGGVGFTPRTRSNYLNPED